MPDEPVPQPAPAPAPTPTPQPEPSAPDPAAVEKVRKAAYAEAKKEADAAWQKLIDDKQAEQERNKLSEADRAIADAEKAKGEAAADRAAAAKERLDARVERRLSAAGVPEAGLAALTPGIHLAPDASDDDIDAAIEALRTSLPGAFGTQAPATVAAIRPSPQPPSRTSGTQIDPARERARQRNGWKPPVPAA